MKPCQTWPPHQSSTARRPHRKEGVKEIAALRPDLPFDYAHGLSLSKGGKARERGKRR
jgi:hypothetical protein